MKIPKAHFKTKLATYLYDHDTCSIAEIHSSFRGEGALVDALSELIINGDLEILEGLFLQWNGTSRKPNSLELRSAIERLKLEIFEETSVDSSKEVDLVEYLIQKIEIYLS